MKTCAPWLLAALLAGCSPQAALLATAVPDGTMSALLSQTQRVEDANRRKIIALEQHRDWAGLARFAEGNLKLDPHTPDWWLVAGYAYTQQQNYTRAAECYMEAVRLEPDASLGWTLLAQSYRASGQPQRAVNTLDKALLAVRDDPQLHWLMGETQGDLQRWRPAIAAYRDAIGVDERYIPAWRGLQRAYEQYGRVDEARDAERMVARLVAEQAAQAKQPREAKGKRDER